jgi:hypothetical protein
MQVPLRAEHQDIRTAGGHESHTHTHTHTPTHTRYSLGGLISTPSITNSCILEKKRLFIISRNSAADDFVPVTLNEVGSGCDVEVTRRDSVSETGLRFVEWPWP